MSSDMKKKPPAERRNIKKMLLAYNTNKNEFGSVLISRRKEPKMMDDTLKDLFLFGSHYD